MITVCSVSKWTHVEWYMVVILQRRIVLFFWGRKNSNLVGNATCLLSHQFSRLIALKTARAFKKEMPGSSGGFPQWRSSLSLSKRILLWSRVCLMPEASACCCGVFGEVGELWLWWLALSSLQVVGQELLALLPPWGQACLAGDWEIEGHRETCLGAWAQSEEGKRSGLVYTSIFC